jgi:hypothetical protein
MKLPVSFGAAFVALAAACTPAEQTPDPDTATARTVDSGLTAVADSEWVDVTGITLVGFHPITTNEQLEKDQGLAGALDNFAYYIGNAMDSLIAAGAAVHYRGGDTIWMRAGDRHWRFVRNTDSSDIGYVFTDTSRRVESRYGVLGSSELITAVRAFGKAAPANPR